MRRSLRRLSGTLPKVDIPPSRDIDMRGLVMKDGWRKVELGLQ
jgi:hypothetical protein